MSASTAATRLAQTLADPVALRGFEESLVAELGLESLLFYREAKRFREGYAEWPPATRRARARKIVRTFVSPSGLYACNLPSSMMRALTRAVDEARYDDMSCASMFEPARLEMFHLLQDAHERYLAKLKHHHDPHAAAAVGAVVSASP